MTPAECRILLNTVPSWSCNSQRSAAPELHKALATMVKREEELLSLLRRVSVEWERMGVTEEANAAEHLAAHEAISVVLAEAVTA